MEPTPQLPKTQEEGVGPLVGIIIIVTLMVLGGIYFLMTKEFAKQQPVPSTETSTTTLP